MSKAMLFSEGPIHLRMIQTWVILVGRAHNRQTINYEDLAKLMTGGTKSALGRRAGQWKGLRLGHLFTYCDQRGLPLLPIIVVTKKTGMPADKAPYKGCNPAVERERVFGYDWFDIMPPTEGDLQATFV